MTFHFTYDFMVTEYKFNGKEKDEETGLYYFGARYYDADLSVWLSVDPLADKRSWVSPYSYCQNNPMNRIDPTGALDWEPEGNGNWKAQKGDNAWTLHKDAGISYSDAKAKMKEQGYSFTNNDSKVDVNVGDEVNVNNSNGYTWSSGSSNPSSQSATQSNSANSNNTAKTINTVATAAGITTDVAKQIATIPSVGYNIAYNSALLKGVNYLKPVGYGLTGLGVMSDIILTLNKQQTLGETVMNSSVTGASLAAGGWPGIIIQANYQLSKAYMKTIIKHPDWAPYPIHGK